MNRVLTVEALLGPEIIDSEKLTTDTSSVMKGHSSGLGQPTQTGLMSANANVGLMTADSMLVPLEPGVCFSFSGFLPAP
jgi:hypothetical protein